MTIRYKPDIMKNPFLFLSFILLFICNSCVDLDDNLKVANLEDVIAKDSEIYQLIDHTTKDVGDPLEDIVCIDFVYPLEVKLYNANLISIGAVILYGDDDFSNFLGGLAPNQFLSISYPITTTLNNGDVFTINNNTELKVAIDNCSREDIVAYCSSVFGAQAECVWKVAYVPGKDNKYVGGTFLINPDNSLVFNYKNIDYQGNWIFLFVNDEFHININLEGTSQVANDWNIDRKMIFTETSIEIVNLPKNIILEKSCQSTAEYAIGDPGPAGGVVFYDKGYYSSGWRYMESAAQDLGLFEWGCAGSSVGNAGNSAFGYGLLNSAAIANYHDNLVDYYLNPSVCNILNNGTVAAQQALIVTSGGSSDWFLPSEDELNLMYINLKTAGYGNFGNTYYWSSTEAGSGDARAIDFANGNALSIPKISGVNIVQTRAVRYF